MSNWCLHAEICGGVMQSRKAKTRVIIGDTAARINHLQPQPFVVALQVRAALPQRLHTLHYTLTLSSLSLPPTNLHLCLSALGVCSQLSHALRRHVN